MSLKAAKKKSMSKFCLISWSSAIIQWRCV